MMENFFVDLAAVAVVLGVMIIVHEFGHFAAAKLFDVRVEQFAIGFGKRLFLGILVGIGGLLVQRLFVNLADVYPRGVSHVGA